MHTPPECAHVIIEICVEDLEGVGIARDKGADRVEYCREIACGGLTPYPATIAEALSLTPAAGLQVLVRSRDGDFVYSRTEITEMCDEIRAIRAEYDRWVHSQSAGHAPVLGFVVGALTPELDIDVDASVRFREAAGPHRLTFHRAFDVLADHQAGLDALVELGYERVLTTGGGSATADVAGLAALIEHADGRIAVLASGGLRSQNAAQVIASTRAREVHMRAPYPGSGRTDPGEVERIVQAIRELPASS